MESVEKLVMESEYEFESVDDKELAKYLKIVLSKEELEEKGLASNVPRRRVEAKGTAKGAVSVAFLDTNTDTSVKKGKKTVKDKWVWEGWVAPDRLKRKLMLSLLFREQVHKVLATAFTGIRNKGEEPTEWAESKVILIKKDENGSDDNPINFCMISLTLNIGKLYHSLEAQRMIDFMVGNKYLDPLAQKAYIEGINGCVEHVTVVQEIIQHAKLKHKTVHITWFDLEDAFGSVPHVLIPFVMAHYNIPTIITKYISNLYSKLKGKVICQDWESDLFQFLKGVFQGDPLSGVIFLIIFNPIIEYIKCHKEKHWYQLTTKTDATFVNTTPFADDFNVISRNIRQHQALVTDVENKLQSMGLIIKAPKCRSLSIQSGKTTNIQFYLKTNTDNRVPISSVIEKPMKFLGSVVQEDNSPHAMFALLNTKLK